MTLSGRKALLQNISVVQSGGILAATYTGQYARFVGFTSCIGSMTIRLRNSLTETGATVSTSLWLVNSGAVNFLDCLNYTGFTTFDIAATTSQAPVIVVYGEPTR